MITLGSLSGAAVAGEFDVLAEPTPSSHYYVDDANVMSKSTRSEIDTKLKTLEVGCCMAHAIHSRMVVTDRNSEFRLDSKILYGHSEWLWSPFTRVNLHNSTD